MQPTSSGAKLSADRCWLRLASVSYINVLNKYDLVTLAARIEHLAGVAQLPRSSRSIEAA